MWNASTETIVDGNTFINCQREIALGLIERTPDDHTGGIVRNNFIYRDASRATSAIRVADSPGTQVLHNTMLVSGTYANAIEYRFANTTGVFIANNLLDGAIAARDGATGSVERQPHVGRRRAVRESGRRRPAPHADRHGRWTRSRRRRLPQVRIGIAGMASRRRRTSARTVLPDNAGSHCAGAFPDCQRLTNP